MRANRVLQIVSCKYSFCEIVFDEAFRYFCHNGGFVSAPFYYILFVLLSALRQAVGLSPCSNNIVFILSNDIGLHSKQYFVKAT